MRKKQYLDANGLDINSVKCPLCRAEPGRNCFSAAGPAGRPHAGRFDLARVPKPAGPELLIGVAIKRRDNVFSMLKGGHKMLRDTIKEEGKDWHDNDDIEGYVTSHGRFLNREQAAILGRANGQVYSNMPELLSSNVQW